jgi:hypothetical protein
MYPGRADRFTLLKRDQTSRKSLGPEGQSLFDSLSLSTEKFMSPDRVSGLTSMRWIRRYLP